MCIVLLACHWKKSLNFNKHAVVLIAVIDTPSWNGIPSIYPQYGIEHAVYVIWIMHWIIHNENPGPYF